MNKSTSLLSNKHVRVKRCRYGTMLFFNRDTYIGRSLELYGEFSFGEAKMFEQIIEDDFGHFSAPQLNHHAHPVFIGLIS